MNVLSGKIPCHIGYGECDIEFDIQKVKQEGDIIYYCGILQEHYSRQIEFTFNAATKEVESINDVSEKYPVFRLMAIDYKDPQFNDMPDIYMIEHEYLHKVFSDNHFADPYYRFSITKNGIGLSSLYYYLFTTVNNIDDIRVKYPKQYYELQNS